MAKDGYRDYDDGEYEYGRRPPRAREDYDSFIERRGSEIFDNGGQSRSSSRRTSLFDNPASERGREAPRVKAPEVAIKGAPLINANVVISSPQSFKDVQTLIDNLKRREPVIFNLDGINKESAQRILDFMSGAAYGLGGSIRRIKECLFLVTPEGVSIKVPTDE